MTLKVESRKVSALKSSLLPFLNFRASKFIAQSQRPGPSLAQAQAPSVNRREWNKIEINQNVIDLFGRRSRMYHFISKECTHLEADRHSI